MKIFALAAVVSLLSIPVIAQEEIPQGLVILQDAFEKCAGNASGGVARFDVETFDAASAMATLKKKDGMCIADHTYSISKADAVKRYKKATTTAENVAECLTREVSEENRDAMTDLVSRKNNLAVLASEPKKRMKNSEACYYYRYQVYLSSGIRINLTFDYTD